MMSSRFAGRMLVTDGFDYGYIPEAFGNSLSDCLRYDHAMSPGLTSKDLRALTSSIATMVAQFANWSAKDVLWGARIDQEPDFFKENLCYLNGIEMPHQYSSNPRDILQGLKKIRGLSPHYVELGSMGFFYTFDRWPESIDKRPEMARTASASPAALSRSWWGSVGYLEARQWRQRDPAGIGLRVRLARSTQNLLPPAREAFTEGVGEFLFDEWNESPLDPLLRPQDFERVPVAFQRALFRGAGLAYRMHEMFGYYYERGWRTEMFLSEIHPDGIAAFHEGEGMLNFGEPLKLTSS